MTHERFIEMLNLYIDRELSAEEIHEVEEAIASSPERQKIYAQYCRIESATKKILAETPIPQPDIDSLIATARANGNELEFPAQPKARRANWASWGGAFAAAAAACVAVVFMVSNESAPTDPVGASANYAAAVPSAPSVEADDMTFQTVFVLDADASDDRLPGMRTSDSFAWMTQLQFAPIERNQIDDWQMKPAEPIEVRSLNPRWISPVGLDDSPPREAVTAFQFQR